MPRRKPPVRRIKSRYVRVPRKQRSPLLSTTLFAGVIVVLMATAGFTFAATQEERAGFCASCHSQPETTYSQRSQAASAVDLASYHMIAKQVKCIDCHAGVGITGRISAELMGARNAIAWYTHTAAQPSKTTIPLGDDNCLKCHPQVFDDATMQNHYHYLLVRWRNADPNAAHCVDCHTSHTIDGQAQDMYLEQARTEAQCQGCHNALGQ